MNWRTDGESVSSHSPCDEGGESANEILIQASRGSLRQCIITYFLYTS